MPGIGRTEQRLEDVIETLMVAAARRVGNHLDAFMPAEMLPFEVVDVR